MSVDAARTAYAETTTLPNGMMRTVVVTTFASNWLIRAEGVWTQDGFQLTHVVPGGPANKVWSDDGSLTNVSLEAGDTIVSINDDAILSDLDWAKAMNTAPDHAKVKLTVVNVQDGNGYDWYIKPQHRPGAGGQGNSGSGGGTSGGSGTGSGQSGTGGSSSTEPPSHVDTKTKKILGNEIPEGFDAFINHTDCSEIVAVGASAVTLIPMAPWVIVVILGITTAIKNNDKGKGVNVKFTVTDLGGAHVSSAG